MQGLARSASWERFTRLRRQRRFQNVMTLGLVVLGPLLAIATFIALGPFGQGAESDSLRLILLADLVYFLALGGMVLARLARMIAARRARSAGSRLHMRLTGIFAGIALVPTILVAISVVLLTVVELLRRRSERLRGMSPG